MIPTIISKLIGKWIRWSELILSKDNSYDSVFIIIAIIIIILHLCIESQVLKIRITIQILRALSLKGVAQTF